MKLDDTRTFNALTETPENMTVRELNQAIRDLRELLHEQTIRAQIAEATAPLKSGDKLKVVRTFYTPAKHRYGEGQVLELIKPTDEAPYGRKSALGNWVVKCPYKISVWSAIWDSVENGFLERIEMMDADYCSNDNWLPANNGTETPFITRTGHRLLYVWQPSTGNHAYLDCETDLILSDVDAQLILDK
jgi:hypothetical protein